MFEAKYLICFDGIELVPGLAPLLVLTNKLKKDLKKEKIGDRKRRARYGEAAPVFGAKSGSGWEGKRSFQQLRTHRMVGSLKAENETNGSKEAAMRGSTLRETLG